MASAGGAGAFKDVILAVVIVGGVLGGLYLYTGVWPPMVVVESGSMMHLKSDVTYGRVGTIDPGDMVFVKKVEARSDVLTMAEGQAKGAGSNYGKPGDVLVYFPFNIRSRTPIIHRSIAYIDVEGADPNCNTNGGNPGSNVQYNVFWEGASHTFGPDGIYLPTMGFGPPTYTDSHGYKPCWSGFITKGDNPVTNPFPDQAFGGGTLPNQPVQISWIEGKAVGELPWFGLIKLALSGTQNYVCSANGVSIARANDPACDNGQAVRVLNANAPSDLWVMLGVSLAAIAIAPLAYDMYALRRRQKQEAAGPPGGAPPPPGSPPPPPRDLVSQLKEKLGLGGKPAGEPGGADPRRAFEPPPPPPPSSQPANPPEPPAAPPPDAGVETPGKTKFQRVK